MATVSYDGQSLGIDGRRIWLVSGSIHYPRVPPALWRRRIRAAREAGLNCIDTYVFWHVHQPVPGRLNFEADADLRGFVQTVAEEGLYCILRPGPFVDAACDFGGLPPWLTTQVGRRVREHHPATPGFLEAAGRFLGAVMEQVRDLQASASRGGPIVLMQAENQWCCHHPQQGQAYLREIVRYLRENGCAVPITLSNNLWQCVESTIDTWTGNQHLAADLRQLRLVKPEAPRILSGYWTGRPTHWGEPSTDRDDAALLTDDLAQVLASGGQYNLEMFHGGTNFGFTAGRDPGGPARFVTATFDCAAPLREAGGRGPKYDAVKRISMFASQFAQVFAHLSPGPPHVVVDPTTERPGLSVVHQRGTHGQVVFVFRSAADRSALVDLLLPDGQTMPVPLGHDRVAWFLLNASLAGVAELTSTNLRPWAFVARRMLVLFGPAGADGQVCVNGATLGVKVPQGRQPLVQQFEGLTLVVLNGEQVDAACVADDRLLLGADGLDDDRLPRPRPGWTAATCIEPEGRTSGVSHGAGRRPRAPALSGWEQATPTDLLDGTSGRYRPIPGPADLTSLECPYGYGWYRLSIERPGKQRIMVPQGADRLHFFQGGCRVGLIGVGPGADDPQFASLGPGATVVLADNLGRFSRGWRLGEPKGLFGHIHAVRPIQLGPPRVVEGPAPDPARIGGFFAGLRYGDRSPADVFTWKFRPSGRQPVVLELRDLPARVMILLNRQPIDLYDPQQSGGHVRYVFEPGTDLHAGPNELHLARFDRHDATPLHGEHVRLYQCTANLSGQGPWAFATWSEPADSAFAAISTQRPAVPTWWRCQFAVGHTRVPLWLEPRGMSKGQIHLNGRNLSRYFVATEAGDEVGPQRRYYLPEPWLRTDGNANVLLLFDEHGRHPGDCRLIHRDGGPLDP